MLSICIPHYNFPNPQLFASLLAQCQSAGLAFEILIADDGSENNKQRYLSDLNNQYFRVFLLEHNHGRSFTRNFLAEKAMFPTLLFLDGDAEIISDDFIKIYLTAKQADIVTGGRIYCAKPTSKDYLLHWRYGTQIEQNANAQFQSNNFIIKKDLFKTVKFDENIKTYGYEDVLFGLEAQKQGFKIQQINNPVKHLHLKMNQQFLDDTDEALQTLAKLIYNQGEFKLATEVRLSAKYCWLKNRGVTPFFNIGTHLILASLRKALLKNPESPLWILALYKLYRFHALAESYKE